MLNLITFDTDDKNLLQGSYDAIWHKDLLEIIVDEKEKQQYFYKRSMP